MAKGMEENVSDLIKFKSYGSSVDDYAFNYFTVAVAIGMTVEDVHKLESKLCDCFVDFRKS